MQSFILPILLAILLIVVWIVTSRLTARRNAVVSLERRKSLIRRTYEAMTAVSERRVADRRRNKENEWIAMLDKHDRREAGDLDDRSSQQH